MSWTYDDDWDDEDDEYEECDPDQLALANDEAEDDDHYCADCSSDNLDEEDDIADEEENEKERKQKQLEIAPILKQRMKSIQISGPISYDNVLDFHFFIEKTRGVCYGERNFFHRLKLRWL